MMMKETERKRRAAVPLNDDVMEEVLLRIPSCKSLLRLRAVCKSWLSIVNDPRFRYLHNLRSAQRPTAVLISYPDRLEVLRFLGDGSRSSLKHALEISPLASTPPSHGFVCLYAHWQGDLMVLNPATGEALILSRPPPCSYADGLHLGFGFHPPTKKYKVVAMCRGHCHVLTVGGGGANSWRTVDIAVMDGFNLSAPVWLARPFFCYNGVLHWFIIHDDANPTLLTFDLGREDARVYFSTTNDADSKLNIDLSDNHGIGQFRFTQVIMLRDSGQTIDFYFLSPRNSAGGVSCYRKSWSFKIVKDHEQEGPADAASSSSAAGAGAGPLCLELGRTLVCDEQGFGSLLHLHLLKKAAEEGYFSGKHLTSELVHSFLFSPVSLHAETLVSLKDL